MDFLGGASRVWGVEKMFQSSLSQVVVIPGGKIRLITDGLSDLVRKYEPVWRQSNHQHPNIVYVMGGIPDITTRLKGNGWGRNAPYEEVVMDTDVPTTLDYVHAEIRSSEKRLKRMGAVPVFCTVTTMDLEAYNLHRMYKGKTSCLMYRHQYPRMQIELNEAILKVNDIIREVNVQNGVMTPDFARYTMTAREVLSETQDTKFKIRTGPSRFTDGCHPTKELSNKWSYHLANVQKDNRAKLSTLYFDGNLFIPRHLSVWPYIHTYCMVRGLTTVPGNN